MQDNARNVVKVALSATLLSCALLAMTPTTYSLSIKVLTTQATLSSKSALTFSVQKATEWMSKMVSVLNVLKDVSSVLLSATVICATLTL
jgi:hypothetical protein